MLNFKLQETKQNKGEEDRQTGTQDRHESRDEKVHEITNSNVRVCIYFEYIDVFIKTNSNNFEF